MLLVLGLLFPSCNVDEVASVSESEELRGQGEKGKHKLGRSNDISNDWIELYLELDRYAYGMRPNATARALAYVSLAAYETAAPAMRDHVSIHRKVNGLQIDQSNLPKNIHFGLALNEAYSFVLNHFLINLSDDYRQKIEDLERDLERELSRNISSKTINESKSWGSYVARQVVDFAKTDEDAEEQILEPQPLSYVPPTGDGYWTYSAEPERALFPYWGSVRTFVISPEETSTEEPLSYSENVNSPYYRQMNEVLVENNLAKANQGEELWIAEFWSDDVEGLMLSPPGRQYSIATQLSNHQDLDLEETLALYLKLGFSLNDAAVSTWKYKYHYMVMRPSNYIREFIDPDFQTNLYRLVYWPNPSFPGYPSGHSCFASAAAGVFIDFFGNSIRFTDRTHQGRTEFLGQPRTFNSFREMAEENAFSRIPLGVHVRMDCDEGYRLGYEISDAVNKFDITRPNS